MGQDKTDSSMTTKSTPTKISITNEGGSSSVPDLTKLNAYNLDAKNIAVRKRKMPESDFTHHFDEFKKEILELLKESNAMQLNNITAMTENITTSMKEQLQDIKNTTELLINENSHLKAQVQTLNDTVQSNKETINALNNEVQQLKISKNLPTNGEDIYSEFQERAERNKNIIIVGIPEQHGRNFEERRELDTTLSVNVVNAMYPTCPKPERVLRVGKYDPAKNRPIKVCYNSHETVKNILRNKTSFKDENIKIYSDQTPNQKKYLMDLQNQLKLRQEKGEENITIKYIRGVPKIITQQSKN